MPKAIKVENLSKMYQLGEIGTGTLSRDLERWWLKKLGKEDPFLKIGEENDRAVKGNSDIVWSLKNISFDIEQGNVVGIIGRNGAGKSTLLKILSRVTAPTSGTVKVKGRIASLLEVGTGFHPELTGRENIYLNGAILGMRKHEIRRKFDEIVAFSGVERYIDTPVKRYSSGMYVRLAFAVAAHLEPEILVVDEVLAVGDAEFQKKCLGKMKDVSVNEGRTVLFVSHNMAAVKELCATAILLKNGQIAMQGNKNEVVRKYLMNPILLSSEKDLLNDNQSRRGNGEVRFTRISINNNDIFLDPLKKTTIDITARVLRPASQLWFMLIIGSPDGSDPVSDTGMICLSETPLEVAEEIDFTLEVPANVFRTGLFPLYFWLGRKSELAEENYPFDVVDGVYHLNYSSDKPKHELGYSSVEPGGYFNFKFHIQNIKITDHVNQ